MELIMMIINEEYAFQLKELMQEQGYFVTEIGKDGGDFTHYGDVVLMSGIQKGQRGKLMDFLSKVNFHGKLRINVIPLAHYVKLV